MEDFENIGIYNDDTDFLTDMFETEAENQNHQTFQIKNQTTQSKFRNLADEQD